MKNLIFIIFLVCIFWGCENSKYEKDIRLLKREISSLEARLDATDTLIKKTIDDNVFQIYSGEINSFSWHVGNITTKEAIQLILDTLKLEIRYIPATRLLGTQKTYTQRIY